MVRYWGLVVVDFQQCYGVDLHEAFASRPWKWFRPLVTGLMYLPDSLLRHALSASQDDSKEEPVNPPQEDEALDL